ncbi:MAG: AAA family ATPase [Candidatus Riflebacteria bacterium]|nr:AAA family ATPase [Candidatus Riflebacteria bacterium]
MLELPIPELPRKISTFDAVDACYAEQLRLASARLRENVSVLIRCEKQIIPYLQTILKRRLTADGKTVSIIDGRPDAVSATGLQGSPPPSRVTGIVNQLRALVNNTEPSKVFFLPYLDIVTSVAAGGLSQEAREIMTIIHENPLLLLVTFEDPDFPLPEIIAQAFPARLEMLGIARNRLGGLITSDEACKFAKGTINLMTIFKFVSGLNPVRFREIMGIFSHKADFDASAPERLKGYIQELRDYTACGGAALSTISLDKDIAGYAGVKKRIQDNILDLLRRATQTSDEKQIKRLESIIPRGMIFHGPPGTGKTLFAKGIAEALNAAYYIISGPELKSKWVGEGEANIRRLFARARATAPSVIVFDELDSIAGARTGNLGDGASQASHSMVNQLLTEMDGFRKEQLVLVIGTTNFVQSLDPAFLRPGRFEEQIEIPYPDWDDRLAILDLYNRIFETGLTPANIDMLAGWTSRPTDLGTPYTGDHLNALIRDLKRRLVNSGADSANEAFLSEWLKKKAGAAVLTADEERVVAVHECGHALLYKSAGRQDEIKKVTLEGGGDSLGFVQAEAARKNHFFTETRLKGEIGVSLGGYAAEKLVFGEVSTGASSDLRQATHIATDMACRYGMGGTVAPRAFIGADDRPDPYFQPQLSPRIELLLSDALQEASRYLTAHRADLDRLTNELIRRRTLSSNDLLELLGK